MSSILFTSLISLTLGQYQDDDLELYIEDKKPDIVTPIPNFEHLIPPQNFYIEIVMISVLFLYALNFMRGKNTNEQIATK